MGTGSTTFPSPNALPETTVSNTSVVVATINLQRAGLYVFNPSATITLWVSPSSTPAVVNGAGSVAIQPLTGGDVRAAQHTGLDQRDECHCQLGRVQRDSNP